jgi:hypothetical protein
MDLAKGAGSAPRFLLPHIVIASEAKQSRHRHSGAM